MGVGQGVGGAVLKLNSLEVGTEEIDRGISNIG